MPKLLRCSILHGSTHSTMQSLLCQMMYILNLAMTCYVKHTADLGIMIVKFYLLQTKFRLHYESSVIQSCYVGRNRPKWRRPVFTLWTSSHVSANKRGRQTTITRKVFSRGSLQSWRLSPFMVMMTAGRWGSHTLPVFIRVSHFILRSYGSENFDKSLCSDKCNVVKFI